MQPEFKDRTCHFSECDRIAVSQCYGSEIVNYHKGHVTVAFKDRGDMSTVNNEIESIKGVDRTELYNYNRSIMISVADGSDAYDVAKEVGKTLLTHRIINQDEVTRFYKTLKQEKERTDGKGSYVGI